MKLETPISCVIPAYNREGCVGRAIESALSQTYPPKEILVIDDGSTDQTGEVARSFSNPAVKVRSQVNQGVSAARNYGAKLATSPWIAWLDSDDFWSPEYLEKVALAIDHTGGMSAIYFADIELDSEQHLRRELLWSRGDFAIEDGKDWQCFERERNLLFERPLLARVQSSVFNAEIFRALGGFQSHLVVHEDTHILMKIGALHSVCAVKTLGTVMTSDAPERLSHEKGIVSAECGLAMWKELWYAFPEVDSTVKAYIHESIRSYLRMLVRMNFKQKKLKRATAFLVEYHSWRYGIKD